MRGDRFIGGRFVDDYVRRLRFVTRTKEQGVVRNGVRSASRVRYFRFVIPSFPFGDLFPSEVNDVVGAPILRGLLLPSLRFCRGLFSFFVFAVSVGSDPTIGLFTTRVLYVRMNSVLGSLLTVRRNVRRTGGGLFIRINSGRWFRYGIHVKVCVSFARSFAARGHLVFGIVLVLLGTIRCGKAGGDKFWRDCLLVGYWYSGYACGSYAVAARSVLVSS